MVEALEAGWYRLLPRAGWYRLLPGGGVRRGLRPRCAVRTAGRANHSSRTPRGRPRPHCEEEDPSRTAGPRESLQSTCCENSGTSPRNETALLRASHWFAMPKKATRSHIPEETLAVVLLAGPMCTRTCNGPSGAGPLLLRATHTDTARTHLRSADRAYSAPTHRHTHLSARHESAASHDPSGHKPGIHPSRGSNLKHRTQPQQVLHTTGTTEPRTERLYVRLVVGRHVEVPESSSPGRAPPNGAPWRLCTPLCCLTLLRTSTSLLGASPSRARSRRAPSARARLLRQQPAKRPSHTGTGSPLTPRTPRADGHPAPM